MKFVDVCCGGGGASLGAVASGFEVALGVDVDVAALRVFKANFPLAKTSNLELPCDKKTLKALFPAEAAGPSAMEEDGTGLSPDFLFSNTGNHPSLATMVDGPGDDEDAAQAAFVAAGGGQVDTDTIAPRSAPPQPQRAARACTQRHGSAVRRASRPQSRRSGRRGRGLAPPRAAAAGAAAGGRRRRRGRRRGACRRRRGCRACAIW